MLRPKIIDLGIVDIGTGGVTPEFEICFNYDWSISTTITGTPGNATYTLEVSHDGIEWEEYKKDFAPYDIEDAIQDDTLPWIYLRVSASSGGASSGTAQFSLVLKDN